VGECNPESKSRVNDEQNNTIEDIVALLADGDITKKDYIYWNVTLDDAERYAKLQSRKVIFRESVIAFLTGGQKNQRLPEEVGEIVKEKKKWLQQKNFQ